MKRFLNLFYTMWSKVIIVIILLALMLGASMCFAETTVLYRENDTALKNVYIQWENYNYETSVYLRHSIEEAIDIVTEYSLYYHRDITDDSQVIKNADDNYKIIKQKLSMYKDFHYAVVNYSSGRIVSDIEALRYKDIGEDVRSFFKGSEENMLIIRDAHNPYFESGTMTDYTEYVKSVAKSYEDNFDLYIYFGEDFSFAAELQDYEKLHNSFLTRVRYVTVMSAVLIIASTLFFIVLLIVSGKTEPGGKVYQGLSDRLPNDLKLLLYVIVIASMTALYENSLYMALRTDTYDVWFSLSAEFYILRSYIAMLVNVCILLSIGCTLKRQYRLGTLLTNTYIYQIFLKKSDRKQNNS